MHVILDHQKFVEILATIK